MGVPALGSAIYLGTANGFGMLGGTVSNTGTSAVVGNVGAITSITGFPPGTATGTVFTTASDPVVVLAYSDFTAAMAQGAGYAASQTFNDLTIDRTFLGNNVYSFPVTNVTSTANIHLTFDAQSDSNETFIIQILGNLTISGPLQFTLVNGAAATNIYWIVGGAATINPTVPITWDGNILAGNSFTMSSGSSALSGTINGCVFATTANTLAAETFVNGCSGAGGSSVPEPGTLGLLSLGCLAGGIGVRKFRVA